MLSVNNVQQGSTASCTKQIVGTTPYGEQQQHVQCWRAILHKAQQGLIDENLWVFCDKGWSSVKMFIAMKEKERKRNLSKQNSQKCRTRSQSKCVNALGAHLANMQDSAGYFNTSQTMGSLFYDLILGMSQSFHFGWGVPARYCRILWDHVHRFLPETFFFSPEVLVIYTKDWRMPNHTNTWGHGTCTNKREKSAVEDIGGFQTSSQISTLMNSFQMNSPGDRVIITGQLEINKKWQELIHMIRVPLKSGFFGARILIKCLSGALFSGRQLASSCSPLE